MNMGCWSTYKETPRWRWEDLKQLYVYGLSGISNEDIKRAIKIVGVVIEEFNLQLTIDNGNVVKQDDIPLIDKLLKNCLYKDRKIDTQCFELGLDKLRIEDDILTYGILVLVDDTRYEFKDPEMIYEFGISDCVSIIRKRWIEKATKHEFGHVIGLGHHNGCIMEYVCKTRYFCDDFKRSIAKIFENKGRMTNDT